MSRVEQGRVPYSIASRIRTDPTQEQGEQLLTSPGELISDLRKGMPETLVMTKYQLSSSPQVVIFLFLAIC